MRIALHRACSRAFSQLLLSVVVGLCATPMLAQPSMQTGEPFDSWPTRPDGLGEPWLGLPASAWLLAGGAVLSSSLLDQAADQWAQRHTGRATRALGSASTAIPWALALGSGLAYTGWFGAQASDTAEEAIKAASFGLVTNLGLRFLVGRARPNEELGRAHFDGLRARAFKSGFASNHSVVAFALATPLARRYEANWLYGVASLASVGRVQKREHWLSDTVAGALIGYTTADLVLGQWDRRGSVRLAVTAQSLSLDWSF